jgi:hypothetical protein
MTPPDRRLVLGYPVHETAVRDDLRMTFVSTTHLLEAYGRIRRGAPVDRTLRRVPMFLHFRALKPSAMP